MQVGLLQVLATFLILGANSNVTTNLEQLRITKQREMVGATLGYSRRRSPASLRPEVFWCVCVVMRIWVPFVHACALADEIQALAPEEIQCTCARATLSCGSNLIPSCLSEDSRVASLWAALVC